METIVTSWYGLVEPLIPAMKEVGKHQGFGAQNLPQTVLLGSAQQLLQDLNGNRLRGLVSCCAPDLIHLQEHYAIHCGPLHAIEHLVLPAGAFAIGGTMEIDPLLSGNVGSSVWIDGEWPREGIHVEGAMLCEFGVSKARTAVALPCKNGDTLYLAHCTSAEWGHGPFEIARAVELYRTTLRVTQPKATVVVPKLRVDVLTEMPWMHGFEVRGSEKIIPFHHCVQHTRLRLGRPEHSQRISSFPDYAIKAPAIFWLEKNPSLQLTHAFACGIIYPDAWISAA